MRIEETQKTADYIDFLVYCELTVRAHTITDVRHFLSKNNLMVTPHESTPYSTKPDIDLTKEVDK